MQANSKVAIPQCDHHSGTLNACLHLYWVLSLVTGLCIYIYQLQLHQIMIAEVMIYGKYELLPMCMHMKKLFIYHAE